MFLTFMLLATWVILGLICSRIAKKKNRNPTTWFYIGFFLGVIGVVIILFLPSKSAAIHVAIEPTTIVPIDNPVMRELRGKHWYYLDESHLQIGPMSFDAFKRSFQEGRFSFKNYVWNEDLDSWKKLEELVDYHSHLEIEKT
ncbi:MAG: DUF4339 domain-containing protein [Chlamydiales bacterium]|nr:DUF4339 domain-containing protein [Chlamydiales bacterium]